MTLAHPGALAGRLITLEPLGLEHVDGLADASRDGDLSAIWFSVVAAPDEMRADVERRMQAAAEKRMYQFAVRRNDSGQIIGMTGYMSLDHEVPRAEIGFTWFGRSAQGSGANPESKLLLMRHAFEVWDCAAVEFSTDLHNHRSREAILRLGAKQDGILRSYRRQARGYLRDLVMFSIIAAEWPAVSLALEDRVRRHLAHRE